MDDDDDKPISLGDIKNIFKRKKADKVEDLKHDTADVEADIKEKKEKAAQLSKEAAKETKEVEEIEKEIEQEEVEAEVIDEEQSRLDDKKKEFNKEIKHTKKEISEIKEKAESEDDENIKLDLGKVKDFFKPKGDLGVFFKKYGTILLLLIPIFFAVFFRAYPYTLPATDEWAQNSVENALKSQIATQINQQYPNLPAANKQKQIDDEYEKMRNERKTEIDQQIEATSNYFKSRLQNEDGQTYLLAIDPYLWYGEARNIINNGHPGDKLVDGKPVYTLRDGRFDKPIEFLLHPWIIAYTYKFMKVFDKSTTILQAAFIIPLLLIALSVIPAFFIGRKIAGNVGGVFAGSLLALNAALLGRTPAGFSDTDAYNIVLPVFAAWFFVEAFKAKDLKKEVMWNILAGLSLGIFAVSWGGWWYTFDFILAAIAGYLFIMLIHTYWKNELLKNAVYSISAMLGFIALALFSSGFFQYLMFAGIVVSFIAGVINILKNWKGFVKADKEYFKQYKNKIIAGALFFVSTGVFVSLLRSPQIFLSSMLGKPTSVITMKDVATKSIWPNVLTTVAEFNESSMTSVIGQMGGGFIFWLALSGIVLLLVNKKKFEPINVAYLIGSLLYYAFVIHFNSTMNTAMKFIIVLSIPIIIGIIKIIALKEEVDHLGIALLILIWVLGTGYGFTKGIRFAILMVPAIAIGFGITAGLIYQFVAKWIGEGLSINKMLSKASVLAVLALLLVSPIISADKVARQEIPSMNDAWYDSLRGITDDSEDAIITSWWDFGHWFVTVAERRVTFDGGDQKRRIHWVGRTLLENDEDIAIGILRMLNCGQEYGFDKLNEFIGDQLKTYNLMIELVVLDGEQAMQKLLDYGLSEDQANEVLVLTHCEEIIPQYYITSQDMIGKSGVWAHFGSWDFKKASMYNQVNDEDYAEGTTILKEKFNLSEDSADTIYYEIQNTAADKWVSGWPSYRSGLASCSVQGNTAKCSDGVEVDLETYDVKFTGQSGTPYSIVYATKEGIVEKKFENPAIPITVALVPNGDSYKSIFMDPELSQSIFTKLFFFNGHGTTHFSLLSDKTTINGEKVQVWKVNFDGQEPLMLEQFMDKKDKVVKSGDEVSVGYIGYLKNGTIFDSSIIGWQELGITANSGFTGYEMNQFTFTVGAGQVIPGFNDAVIGMKINQTKVVEIPPEYAYGTDPAAHPLGNQTLGFKMILLDIK